MKGVIMGTVNEVTPPNKLVYWCQKVLPLVYDDSLSYYEVLGKIVSYTNKLIESVAGIENLVDAYGGSIEEMKKDIAQLEYELNAVRNGTYLSLYLDSIVNALDSVIIKLVANIVKHITFGLSNDGHFVAYIPDTWDFIVFDTVIDTNSELYGHLIMKW